MLCLAHGLLDGSPSTVAEQFWRFDVIGFRAVYGYGAPRALTDVMILLTLTGGVWRDVMVASLLAFRRTRGVACALAAVLMIAGVATTILKHLIGRRRPPLVLSNVHALWSPASGSSFPSGHSAAAFAMAVFLAILVTMRAPRPFALCGSVTLLLWAAGVAMSRVYLGVHFPADAICGAGLGALIGAAGARAYARAPASSHSG